MTIEEKARAYDKVVGKLKQFMAQGVDPLITRDDVQDFFPELKESDDEQHRKWILEYLYDGLRKSDEQFKWQFKCAIGWLEKQGEKPAWSEEDEKKCQETIDWFEKKCFPYALEHENPARESIKWLKSLKQRIGG